MAEKFGQAWEKFGNFGEWFIGHHVTWGPETNQKQGIITGFNTALRGESVTIRISQTHATIGGVMTALPAQADIPPIIIAKSTVTNCTMKGVTAKGPDTVYTVIWKPDPKIGTQHTLTMCMNLEATSNTGKQE